MRLTLIVFTLLSLNVSAEPLSFPAKDWTKVSVTDLGWDADRLDQAVEFANSSRSSALLITHAGRLVVEKYWPVSPNSILSFFRTVQYDALPDGEPVEDIASMQKSVVAVLAEIAAEQGKLDLNQTVSHYLGIGWSEALAEEESKITVRHLMSMTSGLSPGGEFVAPAGTEWQYNTSMYAKMIGVLETATGEKIAALTKTWLADPIGMSNSDWRFRKWSLLARHANLIGFVTTARDLSRLGILMLAQGNWNGHVILKNTEPFTQPSQQLNVHYALLWWLNTSAANQPAMWPAAPADMYSAQGALGRMLFVLPDQQVTVVRLGDKPDESFADQLWVLLADAMHIHNVNRELN